MKTALLISTYNWKEALELILKSILTQSKMPDEILIADDGSTKDTSELIKKYQSIITSPIKHIWQEDIGFRKAQILNKSIAQTDVDYIIQIDGDCILHKEFIADHIKKAKKGIYLYGSRVNILPGFVNEIFDKGIIKFHFTSKEIKNKTRTLHIPFLSNFYKPHEGISKKFRGCNVSYWRKDFIDVNGYNEDFEGWGREDSDLAIRMGNNGILAKRLRYAGIVYHIHHTINSKNNLKRNDELQSKTINEKMIWNKNGINKYLKKSLNLIE